MALVRTNVSTTVKAPGTATSVTTASFTPADNSLVVVFAGLQSSNNSLAASISGGSLTWTKQAQAGVDVSNFGHFSILWTAPVTTGASMTVTVGNMPSDGTAEGIVHVFYYTGHNTSTPVGGTASATAAFNSAVNLTLSSAPATTSEVIAGASDDTGSGAANITTGTGWTQQTHVSDTANTDSQTQTRTSSTSTNVLWNSNAAGTNGCAVAIEIVVATAAGNPFVNNTDLPTRGFVYSEWQRWTESGLTTLPTPTVLTQTLRVKSDFPNPYPVTWYRSWEHRGNSLLPRPTPFRPIDTYAFLPIYYNVNIWQETGNSSLPIPLTPQGQPFNQDLSQNNIPNLTWYQSWTWSGNSLTAVIKSPFSQNSWPNPQPVSWYQSWTQSFQLVIPFNQTDWPLPKTYQPLLQTWSQSLNLFYQSEVFPFIQSDYPNPQRIIWYQDWFQSLLQSTLKPAFQAPFNQFDWPLPRTYQPIDQFWYNGLQLLPRPTPFFQNVDAPLPVISQPIDQTWLQNLLLFFQSNTFPFSQTDWKNPYPIYWFRDYNQNLVIYLPVGIKPFNQSDWPLSYSPQPIDQYYYQALVLNLPEPLPPPEIISSGRQITEAEVMAEVAQWWKRQEDSSLIHPSEFARLGASKGGIARAKALTPTQRSNIEIGRAH